METQPRDPRESYVSLTVDPGLSAVSEHLNNSRAVMEFMQSFMQEFAALHASYGAQLARLVNSSTARFERSFAKKAWLGLTTQGGTKGLKELGTLNSAWQSCRDNLNGLATAHSKLGSVLEVVIRMFNGFETSHLMVFVQFQFLCFLMLCFNRKK